jgi:hypothetical protein
MLDQLVNEYEAAARRLTELHRRWDGSFSLGRASPGRERRRSHATRLEEEMRQAWDDNVEKRNAYLVAAGFPKPA